VQQAIDSYHFAHRQMQECDDKLALYLTSLPRRTLEITGPSKIGPETAVQKRKKARKPRDNEPRMDLKAELKSICGVDLTSIDGVNVMTAFTVISEVGTDMNRFKDEGHFTSWMGLAPARTSAAERSLAEVRRK
jgi:transposase